MVTQRKPDPVTINLLELASNLASVHGSAINKDQAEKVIESLENLIVSLKNNPEHILGLAVVSCELVQGGGGEAGCIYSNACYGHSPAVIVMNKLLDPLHQQALINFYQTHVHNGEKFVKRT